MCCDTCGESCWNVAVSSTKMLFRPLPSKRKVISDCGSHPCVVTLVAKVVGMLLCRSWKRNFPLLSNKINLYWFRVTSMRGDPCSGSCWNLSCRSQKGFLSSFAIHQLFRLIVCCNPYDKGCGKVPTTKNRLRLSVVVVSFLLQRQRRCFRGLGLRFQSHSSHFSFSFFGRGTTVQATIETDFPLRLVFTSYMIAMSISA